MMREQSRHPRNIAGSRRGCVSGAEVAVANALSTATSRNGPQGRRFTEEFGEVVDVNRLAVAELRDVLSLLDQPFDGLRSELGKSLLCFMLYLHH